MKTISTPIDSVWEVAQRLANSGEKTWIPATVPGYIHQDLERAGAIGNPYYRMQEIGAHWIDEADWTYRTTFTVDAARFASRGEHGRHFLRFESLDTIARVFLNETLIASVENGLVPHRFDVTETLRAGENALRIEFDSALRVGQARADEYLGDGTSTRGSQSYFNFGPRAFVRKPQYMFGWDWGPELVSCGIAGNVELITVPVAEITDVRIDYTFINPATVDIRLHITVEKYDPQSVILGTALYAPGDNTPAQRLPDAPGQYTVDLPIYGQPVIPWSPNGSGGIQKRYFLNIKLTSAENLDEFDQPTLFHLRAETLGFRTVELLQEPDADGKGAEFKFRINGIDTFIKGANWIPDSSFPGTITRQQLRERLTQARDAGFNMLRVWGGGLYESTDFYQICSELGLLVWQDFPFACSMYPDDLPEFVEQFRQEATLAVRRLRNYPCLALWCGGNENLELFQDRWAGDTQATVFYGERLINETIPAVLETEDPRTPYLPNSPYGGEDCKSEDFGDSHYWNVWHSKKPGSDGDWIHYAESTTRFSSEFGFASPCGWPAWESVTSPIDRTPRSAVAQWHDKTRKGYDTYLGFIEKHYPKIETFDDLIYYGQTNQADALKFGIEHWRRIKGRCWGTLFWQFNDCWPTQSWAVVDSLGEPKAAYYAAKRFYAPLLLSLVRVGDTLEAHLINDGQSEIPGTLTLQIRNFSGVELSRHEATVTAPINAASGALASLGLTNTQGFVQATFTDSEGVLIAQNLLLLGEPKDLTLPDPGLTIELMPETAGTATITLSTERFAGNLWLRFEGLGNSIPTFSDNWFSLTPGETRTIRVAGLPADISTEELPSRLLVRHL
jgi:beta-mannosidase